MTWNPYHELGLGQEAGAAPTDDDIRHAYRRRAMKAHPDRGGSDEEMQRVTAAYELLTDPERRKRFDETGATDDRAPVQERAFEFLRQGLDAELRGGKDDPVGAVRDNVKRLIEVAKSQLIGYPFTRRRIEKAIKRTSVKQGENLLHKVANQQLERLASDEQNTRDNLDLLNAVLAMLDNYVVEPDEQLANTMSSWTGFHLSHF